jgi:hypothetical protein
MGRKNIKEEGRTKYRPEERVRGSKNDKEKKECKEKGIAQQEETKQDRKTRI